MEALKANNGNPGRDRPFSSSSSMFAFVFENEDVNEDEEDNRGNVSRFNAWTFYITFDCLPRHFVLVNPRVRAKPAPPHSGLQRRSAHRTGAPQLRRFFW